MIYDLILVGGGLANGLLACRLAQLRPDLKWLLLESTDRLGGDHTWSFHSSDVSTDAMAWLLPLVERSWQSQSVHFPAFSRNFNWGYHAIRSATFQARLAAGHRAPAEARPGTDTSRSDV